MKEYKVEMPYKIINGKLHYYQTYRNRPSEYKELKLNQNDVHEVLEHFKILVSYIISACFLNSGFAHCNFQTMQQNPEFAVDIFTRVAIADILLYHDKKTDIQEAQAVCSLNRSLTTFNNLGFDDETCKTIKDPQGPFEGQYSAFRKKYFEKCLTGSGPFACK